MDIYVGTNKTTTPDPTPEELAKRSFMKLPVEKKFSTLYDSMVESENSRTDTENFINETEEFKTETEKFINDTSPRTIKIVHNLDNDSIKRIKDDVEQENIIDVGDYVAFTGGASMFIEYYEKTSDTEEKLIFTERINKYLNNYKLNKNAFTGQVFLGYEEIDEKRYIKVANYSLSMYDNTFVKYEYIPLYDNTISSIIEKVNEIETGLINERLVLYNNYTYTNPDTDEQTLYRNVIVSEHGTVDEAVRRIVKNKYNTKVELSLIDNSEEERTDENIVICNLNSVRTENDSTEYSFSSRRKNVDNEEEAFDIDITEAAADEEEPINSISITKNVNDDVIEYSSFDKMITPDDGSDEQEPVDEYVWVTPNTIDPSKHDMIIYDSKINGIINNDETSEESGSYILEYDFNDLKYKGPHSNYVTPFLKLTDGNVKNGYADEPENLSCGILQETTGNMVIITIGDAQSTISLCDVTGYTTNGYFSVGMTPYPDGSLIPELNNRRLTKPISEDDWWLPWLGIKTKLSNQ